MASSSRQSSARLDRQIPSAKAIRPKPHARSRSVASSGFSIDASDSDSGRVRVAIRLRPKNAEDLACDSDFIDCVELQPELKRLKLKKNNWSSDSYRFDEVLTESASQRRVYEAVAKPVVESVLNGYNGTVMAYGQTGTGKTYTVGQLGKEDPSERGIMVRALEDILADVSPGLDTVRITYLQLYLESIQDLLAPEKTNIPITEDPKTGEVFLPGATMVEIRNLDQFLELLQIGEANRHAANTKLNTESSRSHAILMVHIQRSSKLKEENQVSLPAISVNSEFSSRNVPVLLKSKLLIVDLAGSERVDKSGSEGHMLEEAKFINLSLTSLGKCINALAENSPHIPTRDSKLTRLLRDSFGGTARTSLIVTAGPSARHYSETSSTIMFGQRAMKIVNNLKLKEEFDYESHCRKLEYRVDQLTSEIERQQKFRDTEKVEMEERLKECEMSLAEAEKFRSEKFEGLQGENTHLELKIKSLSEDLKLQKDQNNVKTEEITRLTMSLKQYKKYQLESSTYQKVLADTTQMHEKALLELTKQLEAEQSRSTNLEGQLAEIRQHLGDTKRSVQQRVVDELNLKLQEMSKMNDEFVSKIHCLERVNEETLSEKELLKEEVRISQQKLLMEEKQRKSLEDEITKLEKRLSDCCVELEDKKAYKEESLVRSTSGLGGSMKVPKSSKLRETISGQRDTITKIFEEVGLANVVSMLRSEDLNVQIHAAKVIANLAADDSNQEKIVEEGGLDALLMLLESTEDSTAIRVTAGAIANLAMNGSNQGLIVSKGGARLLANIASQTDDSQTLRMVAGAIANLCGNERLHLMLKEDSGIKSLLAMVKHGNADVIAQVARGIANFAKCESRGVHQGHKTGKSLLIEDGALSWLIANSTAYSSSTRRHIELALCHLAQNEYNAIDIISSGGIKELVHISRESPKEDMRSLAKKALNSNPAYLAKIDRS